MPLNRDTLPTHSRHEFCLALKAARERRGITLGEIAETTKIAATHFAELERNDLRHWPKGLFRRSFFRDYVRMIGVPEAEACAEFVRLFPDEEAKPAEEGTGPAEQAAPANDARLALDPAWHGPRASAPSRLLAALLDAGFVLFAAIVLAWLAGTAPPITLAIVALVYFSLGTALFGESPARLVLDRRQAILAAVRPGPAAVTAAWRHFAHALAHMFASDDDRTRVEAPPDDLRAWVSDARRVGAPRLRVRIKFPH